MEAQINRLLGDTKEIKDQLSELIKQGAVHNHILAEHEKRSTQLETRMTPIEDDLKFRLKAYSLLLGGGGTLGVAVGIVKLITYLQELLP